jgi:cytoskeletal protein RodZ
VTTINAEFALQTNKALNKTEIRMFEEFLKNYIVEMESQCFIEDVTLTLQRLDSIGARRLKNQKLIVDLNVTGRLVQGHSDSKFTQLVKRILFDEDGYLHSRLSDLPLFQDREWISSVSDIGGAPKPHSTIKFLINIFLGVGVTVCGMSFIAIIVFLVTKSKRSNSHTDRESQFIDNTQFPTEIDQELVTTEDEEEDEEEDNDTSTLSSTLVFDNETLENRDTAARTSTFSYSGTSCDSGKDFITSLTSSSIAASQIKREILASNLRTIPLQEKRHASIDDEDMQDISIVETEIDNSELKSKKRSSWTFAKPQSRNNFAQSDVTPKFPTFLHSQKKMIRDLSTVSSLSDKSSYVGSASLNGTPYEVLVAGNKPLGLIIKSTNTGPQILRVKSESPVYGIVDEGDYIISVDGKDTRHMSAKELSQWLHREVNIHGKERTFILMNSNHIEENWLKMAKTV